MRMISKTLPGFGVWLLASFTFLAGCAEQTPDPNWRVHAAFGAAVPGPGTTSVDVLDDITKSTGGVPTLQRFEPGQLASGYNYADAVASGDIEAAYGTPVAHAAKNPAFQYFATIPFGEFETFYGWLRDGGGQSLMDEIYAQHGMKGLACGAGGREGGGWFRQPVDDASDLADSNFMAFGLAGKVLAELGANPVLLPGAQVIPAIQSGDIDAIEFNLPTVDEAFGIPTLLKHHYYPGWHQPFTIYELAINLDVWRSLTPETQRQIERICDDKVRSTFDASEDASAAALDRFRQQGVSISELPPAVWRAAEEAWAQVRAVEFRNQSDAKRIYDSYQAYAVSF